MFNNAPRNIGGMIGISPAAKFLLILNVAVYVLEYWFHLPLSRYFALEAGWYKTFGVGQLFTYMFVHAGGMHLFVNMLGLFFIGPAVERAIGSYRFFVLYYISGILGGLGWSMLAQEGQFCVGASGAVMGILGAFGALYPKAELLLWFVIPVRAWVLVLALMGFELFQTVYHPVIGGIANAAHLVGGLAGVSYAMSLKHPHLLTALKTRLPHWGKTKSKTRSSGNGAVLSKEEVDRILDKIGKEGMGALTQREREMLKRATRG